MKAHAVHYKTRKFAAIDLFAGCGGLTAGLRRAGFEVIGAVECDERTAASYRANNRSVDLKISNIHDVKCRPWMRQLKLRPGELDLLAGCPPCQGFSTLRTRNGSKRNRDKRNALLLDMVRFVRAFRPRALMIENVPGLRNTRVFEEFIRHLESPRLGYRVQYAVHDAQQFGVPQRRRRLVVMAGRRFEVALPRPSKLRKTVRDAIATIPAPGSSGDRIHDLPERRSAKMRQWIAKLPKDGGSRKDMRGQRPCHRRCTGFGDTYSRMRWDSVAPTITSGCFNPSKGRFIHPEENRNITLREAALLQGFPRRYRFDPDSGKEAIALMIGNALPPEFVRRHAASIATGVEAANANRRTPAFYLLMGDIDSVAKRSLIMSRIRSSGNKSTELRAVHILRAVRKSRDGAVAQRYLANQTLCSPVIRLLSSLTAAFSMVVLLGVQRRNLKPTPLSWQQNREIECHSGSSRDANPASQGVARH